MYCVYVSLYSTEAILIAIIEVNDLSTDIRQRFMQISCSVSAVRRKCKHIEKIHSLLLNRKNSFS